jgi:hypothetical protein
MRCASANACSKPDARASISASRSARLTTADADIGIARAFSTVLRTRASCS